VVEYIECFQGKSRIIFKLSCTNVTKLYISRKVQCRVKIPL